MLHGLLFAGVGNAKKEAVARHPDDPKTSLLDAAMYGDLPNVKELVEGGAEVNEHSKDGETALHTACIYGYANVLSYLLQNGAFVDVRATQPKSLEMTPLTWCVHTGEIDAIRALMDGGANLNLVVRDVQGGRITALDIALSRLGKDHQVTHALVSAGALTWKGLISEWESEQGGRVFQDEDWRLIPGVFLSGTSKQGEL
eukprot:g862.t1